MMRQSGAQMPRYLVSSLANCSAWASSLLEATLRTMTRSGWRAAHDGHRLVVRLVPVWEKEKQAMVCCVVGELW
jgi:hypothetical protein